MVERAGVEAELGFPVHPHIFALPGVLRWPTGHDTRALQAYLGHRNIQHTVRYTELSPGVQGFLEMTIRLAGRQETADANRTLQQSERGVLRELRPLPLKGRCCRDRAPSPRQAVVPDHRSRLRSHRAGGLIDDTSTRIRAVAPSWSRTSIGWSEQPGLRCRQSLI